MQRILILLITVTTLLISFKIKAQVADQDFTTNQLQFTFMSTDGSTWQKCTHAKDTQIHEWAVACGNYKFQLHLFFKSYSRAEESTYELNYWADEILILNETHTHSTWLTVDRKAQVKKIVSYLGFTKDTNQLRLEAEFK